MRSAAWLGKHRFELQESPLPEPGPLDAKLKAKSAR